MSSHAGHMRGLCYTIARGKKTRFAVYDWLFQQIKSKVDPKNQRLSINPNYPWLMDSIGTQSVQELFFVIGAFVELFTVMI